MSSSADDLAVWCVYSDTVDYMHLSANSDNGATVLYAVGVVAGSHVSVTSHDTDGTQLSTHLITAPWIKAQHRCNPLFF